MNEPISTLSDEKGPSLGDEARAEQAVIGRLIRRFRVSDSPRHFQTVATTVLRTSLEPEAVAWVPRQSGEAPVVSGSVEGLGIKAYRDLPRPTIRGPIWIPGADAAGCSPAIAKKVRSLIAVAGGSAGWLLAVNPREDPARACADFERMEYVASLIAAQLSNSQVYADLKELLFGVIRGLTAAVDAKDPDTRGHSERVARIAARLGEELGVSAAGRGDLYLSGLLHDVGKIGIDDQVLKKKGPLTPQEYRQIQTHVEIGVTILKDLKKLSHILPGVRHHHETYDGNGYPDRLRGKDIPFEARVLAVADAFDAMSSNRPYRKRLSFAQIDSILTQGRHVQWDADVVDALFACRGDIESIRQQGLGESLIGAVDITLGRN
jgi:HD-GYP domain-containing protein (c-di-GMP phosphodiesterase class II)